MGETVSFVVPAPSPSERWGEGVREYLEGSIVPCRVGPSSVMATVDTAEVIEDGLELRITLRLPNGLRGWTFVGSEGDPTSPDFQNGWSNVVPFVR